MNGDSQSSNAREQVSVSSLLRSRREELRAVSVLGFRFLAPLWPFEGRARPFIDRHEVAASKKMIESKRAFATKKKVFVRIPDFSLLLSRLIFSSMDRVGLFRCDPLCASGIERLTYHRGRIIIRRAAVSPEFRPTAFLVRPFLFFTSG